jgi:hypothetical protein
MDDRAVSTALNYALTLGIATILVIGLLTAGGNFVRDQRDDVVVSELEVIGERLAGDLATTDRLAQIRHGSTSGAVRSELPRRVAGASYDIQIRTSERNVTLALTSNAIDRTVTTPLSNTTAIAPTNVTGQPLTIAFDGGQIEVSHA